MKDEEMPMGVSKKVPKGKEEEEKNSRWGVVRS